LSFSCFTAAYTSLKINEYSHRKLEISWRMQQITQHPWALVRQNRFRTNFAQKMKCSDSLFSRGNWCDLFRCSMAVICFCFSQTAIVLPLFFFLHMKFTAQLNVHGNRQFLAHHYLFSNMNIRTILGEFSAHKKFTSYLCNISGCENLMYVDFFSFLDFFWKLLD